MWRPGVRRARRRRAVCDRARPARLRRLRARAAAGTKPGSATSRRSSPCASREGLDRVALVGHDWGGLIGLRWACDHPDAVWAIVASDTGFFADGRWHGMADALRTPAQGEQLVDWMTLEGFAGMRSVSSRG